MPESEIRQTEDLEKGAEYVVKTTIFNATVLHPLPHPVDVSPYMRDMGNVHLEEDEEVSFVGTAGDLKLYGDVISETPLFKPGQEIKRKHEFIVESDLLAVNPMAVGRLEKIAESAFSSPKDLLLDAASEFRRLGLEASEAVVKRDATAYYGKLVQRAKLIMSLPVKVSRLIKKGSEFASEDMETLEQFSRIAEERLKTYEEDGNDLGLGVLLVHQGTKIGAPNELDKFVKHLTTPEKTEEQTISDLLTPDTKREECVEIIEKFLTPDEIQSLGGEGAADKVVESIAFLGAFAPAPATFDKDAFFFTAVADLPEKEREVVWNLCNRIGLLKDESVVMKGRVSISKDLAKMLRGYLTDD